MSQRRCGESGRLKGQHEQCSCFPVRTEPGGGTDCLESVEKVEADERFMAMRVDWGETATGWTKPSSIGSSGAVLKRSSRG